MKRSIPFAASLLLLAVSSVAWAQTPTAFTATYKGGSSSCGTTYSIKGKEPADLSTHPVFVYLVGTSEAYDVASATSAVDRMAQRGYVAATVQYPNSTFGSCSTLASRAKCVFDGTSASSAIAALCSRARADCAKGVVVGGFSQGSVLAVLARNYEPRVQAAYGLGVGVQYSTYDLRACMADGKHTLTSDRLRAVNGEADGFMGGAASSVRSQLQELTGLSCGTGASSCFRSNGSGWYLVAHAEVSDGTADHCYMRMGGCGTNNASQLDQKWLNGTYAWSVDTNLDWLTQFTQR